MTSIQTVFIYVGIADFIRIIYVLRVYLKMQLSFSKKQIFTFQISKSILSTPAAAVGL